jgi:hypothetical protein
MPRERESQKGVYRRKKSSPHLLLGFGANHELGVVKAEPAVFTFQHKQTNKQRFRLQKSDYELSIPYSEVIYGLIMNRRFWRDMKLELPPILEYGSASTDAR